MKDAYEDEYGEEPGGGGVWDPDKAGPPVNADEPITDWRKWFEDLYKSKGFSGYSESNLAAMEADLTSKGWQLQKDSSGRIRGRDIRSIGPRDPRTGLVLGGNKSLLFNAEYLISIAGPVRLVMFYDAGQVRPRGEPFSMQEDFFRTDFNLPPIVDPFAVSTLVDPNAPGPTRVSLGEVSAFKVSTGAEIRFFMPVLNVPFRLIVAANPQRAGAGGIHPPVQRQPAAAHLPEAVSGR